MSCYRKQKVLKIAADWAAIHGRKAYERFGPEQSDALDYAAGHMSCSLANSGNRL